MTNFEVIDNINFVALSNRELMDLEGGAFLTATIGDIAVWKILGSAGYLINKRLVYKDDL